jgi:GMP synthase (glutamine-hydrolysing)
MRPLPDITLLLIQARDTPEMEHQEQQCFIERCGIAPHQLRSLNVVRDALDDQLLADADALLIGGAGEYSAWNAYPWMDGLLYLIQQSHKTKLPTFGSCWGHQLMARAMGGEVAYDHDRVEFGCCEVRLTEAGRADPLFGTFPTVFKANMGHRDRVVRLPEGAIELARNETQPNEAFRMPDAPFYGTQFHSELDAERERERLIAYREHYIHELGSEELFQDVLDDLADTSEVDSLLSEFVHRWVVAPTE